MFFPLLSWPVKAAFRLRVWFVDSVLSSFRWLWRCSASFPWCRSRRSSRWIGFQLAGAILNLSVVFFVFSLSIIHRSNRPWLQSAGRLLKVWRVRGLCGLPHARNLQMWQCDVALPSRVTASPMETERHSTSNCSWTSGPDASSGRMRRTLRLKNADKLGRYIHHSASCHFRASELRRQVSP